MQVAHDKLYVYIVKAILALSRKSTHHICFDNKSTASVRTIELRPEDEVGQETTDDIVVDGVHVGGGGFRDERSHVQ